MTFIRRTAAGAALALTVSVGFGGTADAQLDTSQIEQLIVEVQDSLLQLGEDLGNVTEDLGQEPGVNEVLSFAGYLLTDGLVDIVQAILEAVN